MSQEYVKDSIKIHFILKDDVEIIGYINMNGYDKFSNFMEKDDSKYLKVYDVYIPLSFEKENEFILLPKESVLFYIPVNDKK